MPKLTKRTVDALRPSERESFAWDSELRGFGVRMMPSGVAAYLVQYRTAEGRTRRLAVGRVGTMTPEEARGVARDRLVEAAKGADPSAERRKARRSMTLSDVCDWYLKAAAGHVKASTLAMDKSRIERHVKPLIGRITVGALTRADVSKMQADIAGGRTARKETVTPDPEQGTASKRPRGGKTTGGSGVAARTVGMLGTILEFAKREGAIEDNPARGVKKLPEGKRQRFLSAAELKEFGKVLRAASNSESRVALAAIRFLLLTGCRRMEVLGLKWSEVDLPARSLRLSDTKSGAQVRAIGAPAVLLLKQQVRQDENPYVFPGASEGRHFVGLPKVLARLCGRAKIDDVSLHTLRHTFASTAAGLGFSELTIAGLLGHSVPGVTARYAHVADRALLLAADQISAHVERALLGKAAATNVVKMQVKEERRG